MTQREPHFVAWVYGSLNEDKSEVFTCQWRPDFKPQGNCLSYHTNTNITDTFNNWAGDESGSKWSKTKDWESKILLTDNQIKWKGTRPFKT